MNFGDIEGEPVVGEASIDGEADLIAVVEEVISTPSDIAAKRGMTIEQITGA